MSHSCEVYVTVAMSTSARTSVCTSQSDQLQQLPSHLALSDIFAQRLPYLLKNKIFHQLPIIQYEDSAGKMHTDISKCYEPSNRDDLPVKTYPVAIWIDNIRYVPE